jgi:hypothetical protein
MTFKNISVNAGILRSFGISVANRWDEKAISLLSRSHGFSADYVRDGDFSPTMYNPDLVDELNVMKEGSWLTYVFDS